MVERGGASVARGWGVWGWSDAEAVFLVAFAGLDGLDGAIEGEGDEEGPREVGVVSGEVEGETGGVFDLFVAEAGAAGGALGEGSHCFEDVRLAEVDEGLSAGHGRTIPGYATGTTNTRRTMRGSGSMHGGLAVELQP